MIPEKLLGFCFKMRAMYDFKDTVEDSIAFYLG